MNYLPPEKKPAITATRIALWVAVGGVGLWMLGSGLIGILNR